MDALPESAGPRITVRVLLALLPSPIAAAQIAGAKNARRALLQYLGLSHVLRSYPFGWLSDRMSYGKLLALGLVALALADVVPASGNDWKTMLVGVALWGIHMGVTQGLLATMVADTAPADLRGTPYGVFNLMSGLTMLIASGLAEWLWDRQVATPIFECAIPAIGERFLVVNWRCSLR